MVARVLLGICLLSAAGPWGLAASPPPANAAPVVGLMAAAEPAITASLEAGARLALATWERKTGLVLSLIVAEPSPAWAAASGPAVEMAFEDQVVALITPPARQTAHLLAQLGTRAHLPIVSTSAVPSVTTTGSFWVVSVAAAEEGAEAGMRPELVAAYRAAEGREPDGWAVLGYDAAATIAAAVELAGLDRRRVMEAWRSDLVVAGAGERFGFDGAGRRRAP